MPLETHQYTPFWRVESLLAIGADIDLARGRTTLANAVSAGDIDMTKALRRIQKYSRLIGSRLVYCTAA